MFCQDGKLVVSNGGKLKIIKNVTLKRSVERQGSLERIQVGGMRYFRKKGKDLAVQIHVPPTGLKE